MNTNPNKDYRRLVTQYSIEWAIFDWLIDNILHSIDVKNPKISIIISHSGTIAWVCSIFLNKIQNNSAVLTSEFSFAEARKRGPSRPLLLAFGRHSAGLFFLIRTRNVKQSETVRPSASLKTLRWLPNPFTFNSSTRFEHRRLLEKPSNTYGP